MQRQELPKPEDISCKLMAVREYLRKWWLVPGMPVGESSYLLQTAVRMWEQLNALQLIQLQGSDLPETLVLCCLVE